MTATTSVSRGSTGGWQAVCFAPGLLLLGLAAAIACSESNSPVAPGGLRSCSQVSEALDLELASIQACGSASECGQVLRGTSCGCTRDLVARQGVSTADFYAIVERGRALQCPATDFVTVCDCPAADGFACVAGRCTWNYL